jgi:hypothetical protein
MAINFKLTHPLTHWLTGGGYIHGKTVGAITQCYYY